MKATSPADDYPIALLANILDRVVDDAVEDALTDSGYTDLSRATGVVFEMIDDDGSRVTDMARRARMTKQGMGHLVATVEALGYVERVDDATDGRAQLVLLTRRGRQAAKAGGVGLTKLEDQWRSLLGERRYETVRRALAELVAATGADHVRA